MKKMLIVSVVCVIFIFFVACDNNSIPSQTFDVTPNVTEYPYEIYDLNIGIYPLFDEDLIVAQNDQGLFGYINNEGDVVIAFQYGDADAFNDNGYAIVSNSDECSNIIDTQGNSILTENVCNVNQVQFSDELIFMSTSDGFLIYDYQGNLEMNYVDDLNVVSQLYPELVKIDDNTIVYSQPHNGMVLVDENWRTISRNAYDGMDYSYRNLLSVYNDSGTKRYFGMNNYEGEEIIPPIYENDIQFGEFYQLSDVTEFVTTDFMLGFKDYTGQTIIDPIFDVSNYDRGDLNDYEFLFSYGVQKVPDKESIKIIDYLGNVLFEASDNQYISDYDDQRITIYVKSDNREDDTYYSYVIDYSGNIIHQEMNHTIVFTKDSSDIFFVIKDNIENRFLVDMYNYAGELLKSDVSLLRENFQGYYSNYLYANFYNGLLALYDEETGKIGFVDETGSWRINPQFEYDFSATRNLDSYIFYTDGFALIYNEGLYAIINRDGDVVSDYYRYIQHNTFDYDALTNPNH